MARILGLRARLLVLVGAVALVAAGCLNFTGEKVIEGDAPPDAEFVVTITCVNENLPDDPAVRTMTFEGEETKSTFPFDFIPLVPGETTCTIVETEQAGATSVAYECGDVDINPLGGEGGEDLNGNAGMSAPTRGNGTTAECFEFDDRLEVVVNTDFDPEIEVEFTVINTFEEPPPTTAAPTTTTAPAPAPAAPAAEAGEVTFTG